MSYTQPPSEPVAIVGSGCRFAGGITSPSKLWNLLQDPPDLSRDVPPGRFNIKAFYHPDGEYHGTTNSPKAYWLDQDHRVFDSAFFNITPKEAEAIDPQQRMLLEVVYEALESAGYTLQQYAGDKVAVFAGIMTADYDTLSQRDDLTASQYYATGNARSIISNRISYFFNFNGPSATIDTACSSSLVALHQAVLSLRSGESVMACVTGANLMITPEQFIVESNLHMLSPSGHCRMWDAGADGYARGEGIAALLLKPLSRALADGDRIEAVIRETGVNSDGRTQGITMPNPAAQARLIRDTYRKTGLDPRNLDDRCQYFEAHGTGTHAGDPREAAAIEDAFFGEYVNKEETVTVEDHSETAVDVDVVGRHTIGDRADLPESAREHPKTSNGAAAPLLVGSVKTVIGHTEGAAGLAGVMKVVQAMRQGSVPPNLHLQKLNPSVEPFYSNLTIPTKLSPWPEPRPGQPRRASVNSFGFGGTNAHAIIERYEPSIHDAVGRGFSPTLSLPPTVRKPQESGRTSIALPLLLSANSQSSLVAVAESYRDYLAQDESAPFENLVWHTYARRTALPYKAAVSGASAAELQQELSSLVDKARHSASASIGVRSRPGDGNPRILGIFTGQGAQWPTMSKGLLANSVYHDTIRSLDGILRDCPHPPSWTLEQQISAEDGASDVDKAAVAQPLCTALQIGLVDLLRSLGIGFHTVVGHSSGEICAAYAAGRVSSRDAILISYYRGMYAHLAGATDGRKGGMLAVGLSKDEATELCAREEYNGHICMAASNAPSSVTLSGDLDVLHKVRDDLAEQKKFARMLMVDTAYHSPHMETPAVKYLEVLEASKLSPVEQGNGTVWISSVHGAGEPRNDELDALYWKDNMVRPVLFREAVATAIMESDPFDFAIEVGPHPALKGPATQTMKAIDGNVVPYSGLLDRKKEDGHAFADFLGTAWMHLGPGAVLLRNFIQNSSGPDRIDYRLENMPSYPWDHSQIHYKESRVSRQYHFRTHAPHELLGNRTRDDNQYELRWRNILKLDKVPWISHHKFQGQALLPASAYCVMAVDAARVVLAGRSASVIELEDLEFMSGIIVEPESQGVEILFALTVAPSPKQRDPQHPIEASFTITSAPADGASPMKKNFAGRLRIVLGEPTAHALPTRPLDRAETMTVSPGGFYDMMSDIGLSYSGPFAGLEAIDRRLNFSVATLRKRHKEDTTQLSISPATLDTCLQSAFATLSSPGDRALWTSFLPKTIERVRFNLAICDLKPDDDATLTVDAYLTNFKPLTKESAANFTGDICVFNDVGKMEIQVEGLTVASFSATRPENDYELYLTTVMDVDPEDEIISDQVPRLETPCPTLVECCERVASFYLNVALPDSPPPSPRSYISLPRDHLPSLRPSQLGSRWPEDTLEVIEAFIRDSPYATTLEFVRSLGENLRDVLPGMLPTLIEEAHHLVALQRHLSRVARQIAHRYPRMNILGLTDPDLGLTAPIIAGLKNSFLSYTVGSASEKAKVDRLPMLESHQKKFIVGDLDLGEELDEEHAKTPQYDLVILSTSLVKNHNSRVVLKKLNRRMRPGGFLVLIHVSQSSLKERVRRCAGFRPDPESNFTPPDWPDVLDECGFGHSMTNSYQSYPLGFSLIIRQAESEAKQLALQPLATSDNKKLTGNLLIVGGQHEEIANISSEICQQLSPRCIDIAVAQTFDDIDKATLSSCTAVILLNDLDNPILSDMTEDRLETLRALVRPDMVLLWVTRNARFDNPDHAASFGFARTMLAETPSLLLRMLDLQSLDNSSGVICEEFARLITSGEATKQAKAGGVLWSYEPEVHIEDGHRLVPRVLPWTEANGRVNASRRVVSEAANTLEQRIEIVASQSVDGSARYDAQLNLVDPRCHGAIQGQTTVLVDYSSVDILNLGWEYSSYVCVGRNSETGETQVVLSKSNSSVVTVPAACAKSIISPNYPGFLRLLLRYLTVLTIAEDVHNKSVLLVEPDDTLLECVENVFSGQGTTLHVCTLDAEKGVGNPRTRLLHPNSSNREIKALFPPDGTHIFDFLPEGNRLSDLIVDSLPNNCEYHSRYSLLNSDHLNTLEDASGVERIWELGINLALQGTASGSSSTGPSLFSVPDLLNAAEPTQPFQVLDWRKERNVQHIIRPLVETQLLRAYKTYLLVGLTRDFGYSLCKLFAEHGARNIVLVSRNPNKSPKWKDELVGQGVNIHIEALDVTNLDDVLQFKEKLAETMPPVAGIVNGAMVLEDRVFAQMTLDTLNRVMRPKTVGSKNLDTVFDSPDMEFFIMTSSFAAIGGHAGQSNYAAANMYMNGLAASRRRRGLPGTALNIGVIYGLGFLHREKDDLYTGLEREGYPPISERDIHHMFLEAIVAGRPSTDQVADITTGLSRYRVNDPNPLHWHRDPRFSHYTVLSDDDEDGEDGADVGAKKQSVKDALEAAGSAREAAEVLARALAERLESLLRLPADSVGGDNSVAELGVDSLAAVEIRSWIWRAAGRDVAVMKILGAGSITSLCREIAEGMIDARNADTAGSKAPAPPVSDGGTTVGESTSSASSEGGGSSSRSEGSF